MRDVDHVYHDPLVVVLPCVSLAEGLAIILCLMLC